MQASAAAVRSGARGCSTCARAAASAPSHAHAARAPRTLPASHGRTHAQPATDNRRPSLHLILLRASQVTTLPDGYYELDLKSLFTIIIVNSGLVVLLHH